MMDYDVDPASSFNMKQEDKFLFQDFYPVVQQ